MTRLEFTLPEVTRIAWVSERAREVWEPRITAIGVAWPQIERVTVVSGLRPGGLQCILPEDLIAFQQWCIDQELDYILIARDKATSIYSNASTPVEPGKPWAYRVYFGDDPVSFAKAWSKDELYVGHALGYPQCCSKFFKEYWNEAGWRDLTFAMASFQPGIVRGPYTCNILLRHIGVRPVFHLPCSFDCMPTTVLGDRILEYGRMLGFVDEMDWITEILNWPIRWNSLHGIAIITTPVLKIVASSDSLSEPAIIDREGSSYPTEGATGVEFPFRETKPIPMQISGVRDVWTDNGFLNYFSMKHAHDLIMSAIDEISIGPGKVLDLGCGNGVLLKRIKVEYPDVTSIGVETDAGKCNRAAERGNEIHQCSIVDTTRYLADDFTLILISLNRLLELNPDEVDLFLTRLKNHTKFLIIYSYQDWNASLDTVIPTHFSLRDIVQTKAAEARILRAK